MKLWRMLKRFWKLEWLGRFRKPNQCRIEEEWSGSFIGRRHCRTHGDVWDGGGSCPRTNSFLGWTR